MSATYILQRTLSTGETLEQIASTKRAAAVLASYVLYDNGYAGKAEAQTFAATLDNAPLGTALEAHGYTFKIVSALRVTAPLASWAPLS